MSISRAYGAFFARRLQVAVGRRSHVSVFGNDYDTPDGTGKAAMALNTA